MLGERTLVMGILNVTPDSFSEHGRYQDPQAALERARELEAEGADIVDIGGESTRPGSEPVSLDEELRRVMPVLEAAARTLRIPISVDTSKPGVARRAVAAGAALINYVATGPVEEMARVAAESNTALLVMHIRGTPQVMHQLPPLPDVLREVEEGLERLRGQVLEAGLPASHLLLDPGFGFGKNGAENFELLAGLGRLHRLGHPLVVGTSRKSFIGKALGIPADQRDWGTAATVTAAILAGAHVVRVHDVAAMVQVSRVADQILGHAKMAAGG